MLLGKLKYLFVFTAIFLFCSLFDDLPYIYFQILRFIVTLSAVFYAFISYAEGKIIIVFIFGIIAVLFNPLIPFHMSRESWAIIDIVTGIIFLIYGFSRRFSDKKHIHNTGSIVLETREDKILSETIDEVCDILEMPHDLQYVFKRNVFLTEREFYIEKIKEFREPFGMWLFLFAANFAADNLESGGFHTYRGILSMEGQTLWRIFIKATELAVKRGALDQATADKNIETVRKNIKQVG